MRHTGSRKQSCNAAPAAMTACTAASRVTMVRYWHLPFCHAIFSVKVSRQNASDTADWLKPHELPGIPCDRLTHKVKKG
jgi:hypothetical protein